MSEVSTHVLDTSRGVPAEGVAVRLERQGAAGTWQDFGTEVTGARWDDAARCWCVAVRIRHGDGSTTDDELVAHHLVAAIGPFGRAKLPRIDGADSFRGDIFHTTRWPTGMRAEAEFVMPTMG